MEHSLPSEVAILWMNARLGPTGEPGPNAHHRVYLNHTGHPQPAGPALAAVAARLCSCCGIPGPWTGGRCRKCYWWQAEVLAGPLRIAGWRAEREGRLADAERIMRAAIRIAELLGPPHLFLAVTWTDLANLYLNCDRIAEAAPLCEGALAIARDNFRPLAIELMGYLNNLARLRKGQGRPDEAEGLYLAGLSIWQQLGSPVCTGGAVHLMGYGQFCREQGRATEAEALFRRALTMRDALPETDSWSWLPLLGNFAVFLEETGRPVEAQPVWACAQRVQAARCPAN